MKKHFLIVLSFLLVTSQFACAIETTKQQIYAEKELAIQAKKDRRKRLIIAGSVILASFILGGATFALYARKVFADAESYKHKIAADYGLPVYTPQYSKDSLQEIKSRRKKLDEQKKNLDQVGLIESSEKERAERLNLEMFDDLCDLRLAWHIEEYKTKQKIAQLEYEMALGCENLKQKELEKKQLNEHLKNAYDFIFKSE